MMPPSAVTFHPAAAREYQQARRWYAVRSLTAASGFVEAVREAVERITDRPAAWSEWRARSSFCGRGGTHSCFITARRGLSGCWL